MDTPQNPKTQRSRALRKTPTHGECLLWKHLRSSQLKGAKFRRQMPVGPYFADFACPEFRCIVEIDGSSHEDREVYDADRDKFMHSDGWTVLRFTEKDVCSNIEGVLEAVGTVINGK